jgi:hypothetical protein
MGGGCGLVNAPDRLNTVARQWPFGRCLKEEDRPQPPSPMRKFRSDAPFAEPRERRPGSGRR